MRQCFGRAIPGTSEALWEDRGPRIMTTMDQPLSEVGDPSAEKALGRWMHLTPQQDAARRKYNADATAYETQLTRMQIGGQSDILEEDEEGGLKGAGIDLGAYDVAGRTQEEE